MIGLGVAQLLAWGALYYAIAIIGDAMSVGLGVTREWVFGSFTWALVVSGFCAPLGGRMLDRYGGRTTLIAGAMLGAFGFVVLGNSHTSVGLLIGWSINGVAMALGLYEACFAAIGQVAPHQYPRLVTSVTLIAGFASTVSWPASHYLMELVGWRWLCLVYAIALCAGAVIYRVVLPGRPMVEIRKVSFDQPPALDSDSRRRVRVLAWTFAGMALVSGALSAHLLTVFKSARVSDDQAVWLASSIGVTQVLGRLMLVAFGHRDAVRLGLVTFAGFLAASLLLIAGSQEPWLLIPFALLYGVANGLVTIVKATLPVQVLGGHDIGRLLGTFSRPGLIARAVAPWLFAATLTRLGVNLAVVGLTLVAAASLVAYVTATRRRGEEV